jgi:hypothetical protein
VAEKKKKEKKKKKNKTTTSPSLIGKSKEETGAIVDLGRWLSEGAPLTRKAALQTDFLIRAAKAGHVEAARALLKPPGIRVLLELLLGPKTAWPQHFTRQLFAGTATSHTFWLLDSSATQVNRAGAAVDGQSQT